MENKSNISELLSKPLWQMTGEEYYELTQFALASSQNADRGSTPAGQKALGVHALAVELGCSDSTIYALMRAAREEDGSAEGGGILKPAIVSRIGRRIVFDVDTARRLADGSLILLMIADSQNQYRGILCDWLKTLIVRKGDGL